MVAVVSGSGLGLFGATVGGGAAGIGQGRDRIYVNSTTGNLILQSQDEQLAAVGLDLSLTRTYNAQGLMDDDNGDQWRLNAHARLSSVTGTLNAAGSNITLTFGDGRAVVYAYDVMRALYLSTDGPDAHDTLSYAGGQWTWTDGSARNTLSFDGTGRLTAARDRDGNTVSYGYTGDLLSSITDASGQVTTLEYHAGTRDLARIRVTSNNQTQVLTSYFYDSAHRLSQVRVDLTPENAADAVFFDTTYTYDGASHRIASLTQADGATVSFTYEPGPDGQHRVKSYTEGTGAAARTTHFSYEAGGAGGGSDSPEAPDPFGATQLTSFVPVQDVSVAAGAWRYYAITVPEGTGELSIASRFGSGDADLYVRRGALPTRDTFDAKGDASPGNDEGASVQNPAAGVWYVGGVWLRRGGGPDARSASADNRRAGAHPR